MRRLGPVAALAAALAMLGAAVAAHADSLVYMNGGNVWISHGDGTNAKQVTGGSNTWSWPTEDDQGNILVAGGAGGINPGEEDTPGSEVYRLNQQGASLSAPQTTPGSHSTVSCPTYPPVSLRVAPDGQHYAYHSWWGCIGNNVTELGTVGGAGITADEDMPEFAFPYWVDNGDYAISRGDEQFSDCNTANGLNCEWWVRDVGDPDGSGYGFPWFTDTASSATGFDAIAISRDGTKFASIEDDAADYVSGAAQNVELRLWSISKVPTAANSGDTSPAPTYKCQFTLPADPGSTLWFDNAGPTFSPDGTKLAFAEPDGIHVADVSSLSCGSAPLVIPGGTQPFWSAADESPNAGYVPPSPPASGGGGTPPPAKDTTPPVIGTLRVSPKRFAVSSKRTPVAARAKKGATVRYVLSEPARVSLKIVLVTKKRRKTVLRSKGTLVRSGQSGANQLGFSGRIGSRKLSAGKYEIVATAVDPAGNRTKSARTTSFTIVRK